MSVFPVALFPEGAGSDFFSASFGFPFGYFFSLEASLLPLSPGNE